MAEDPSSLAPGAAAPDLTLDIILQDRGWQDELPGLEALVQGAVEGALREAMVWGHFKTLRKFSLEISFCFAGDEFVQKLNADFRDKDKPTNVLSFPSAGGDFPKGSPIFHLGDVVLARGVVEKEALEQGKTFSDHTMHLVLHGLLHLLGFDHDEQNSAEEMEALEVKLLKTFGIGNPYE